MKCVALISLSNGLPKDQLITIKKLEILLSELNLKIIRSNIIFTDDNNLNYSGKERARELMKLYKNNEIDAIFDVSGGDLTNEILDYLDFSIITLNYKPLFGYSDLSVILNSIYCQINKETYLYQIKNIIFDKSKESLTKFNDYILNKSLDLFKFKYKWLQGSSMKGILVGGNLRCTLKLSGTKYMPDFKNKIILIESLSGSENKIRTLLTQYKQMGAFDYCNGVILGTFTELENEYTTSSADNLILDIIDTPSLPIIKTNEIGHNPNSKAIVIGKYYKFNK